jgi:hypothetical protein
VAKHGTPKTDNGETNKMNAPTNNNEPKDADHITRKAQEGTRIQSVQHM